MFTREDYLEQRCTHREYYGQFAKWGKYALKNFPHLIEGCRASKDKHFNDVASLSNWDRVIEVFPFDLASLMRQLGDCPTKAGAVCIAKEAARQIIEQGE